MSGKHTPMELYPFKEIWVHSVSSEHAHGAGISAANHVLYSPKPSEDASRAGRGRTTARGRDSASWHRPSKPRNRPPYNAARVSSRVLARCRAVKRFGLSHRTRQTNALTQRNVWPRRIGGPHSTAPVAARARLEPLSALLIMPIFGEQASRQNPPNRRRPSAQDSSAEWPPQNVRRSCRRPSSLRRLL